MKRIMYVFYVFCVLLILPTCSPDTGQPADDPAREVEIFSILPSSCYINAPDFTIQVRGRFYDGSKIILDGEEMETTFPYPDYDRKYKRFRYFRLTCRITPAHLEKFAKKQSRTTEPFSSEPIKVPVQVWIDSAWMIEAVSNTVHLTVDYDPILFSSPRAIVSGLPNDPYLYDEVQEFKFQIDNEGNLYLVWLELEGTRKVVHVITSMDEGDTWGNHHIFEREQSCLEPSLAVDHSGKVYVAWWEGPSDIGRILLSSSSDNGKTWESPTVVSTGVINAINPVMAFDPSGGIYMLVSGPSGEFLGSTEFIESTLYLNYFSPEKGNWIKREISSGWVDGISNGLIDRQNNFHLCVSIDFRLLYLTSSDRGKRWYESVMGSLGGGNRIEPTIRIYPEKEMLYVRFSDSYSDRMGGYHSNFFLRSSDNGKTWSDYFNFDEIASTTSQGGDMVIDGKGIIYALLPGNPVYLTKSTDRGDTWSPPMMFEEGIFPILSVTKEGILYVLWQKEDQVYFCRRLN